MRPPRPLILLLVSLAAVLAAGLSVVSADDGDEVAAETITTTLSPGDNIVGWVTEPKPVTEVFEAFPQIELIYTWDPYSQQYRYAHPDVEPGSGALELVRADIPVVIRIGDAPSSVQELFDAEPRIELIYRWNELQGRWNAAWPALPEGKRTLDALAPGTTAVIRVGGQMTAQELYDALLQVDLIYGYDEAEDRHLYALSGLAPAVGGLNKIEPGMSVVVRLGGEEPVEWERSVVPVKGLVELHTGDNWVSWAGPDDWSVADAL